MATPIYYPTTTNAVQKTLDAELLAGVTASATLNNVTGLQNKKGIMVIDRVDGNNNLTPSKREYISFDGTSGVTVTTLGRGLGGSTDQDHAVGAIVEFVNDVVQQQAIIDGLLLTVTTAGALNKATGATINTGTADDTIVTPKALADATVGKLGAAWTAYTPAYNNVTIGNGALVARYIQIGKMVHAHIYFILGSTSAIGTDAQIGVPVAAKAGNFCIGSAIYIDGNLNNWYIGSWSATKLIYSTTYGALSATVPFTWDTTDVIMADITYEAA